MSSPPDPDEEAVIIATVTPGMPAPALLLRGYGRGVGWTYLSLLLTGASTFFLAAWSVRRVGTAQYGLFALVTALTALLAMFDYALGLTVQRAGARVDADRDGPKGRENQNTVRVAHGAYALLGLVAVGTTLVASALVGLAGPVGSPYLVQTVALLGLATSLEVGTAALPAVVLGSRRFSLRSGATIAGVVVRVGVALLSLERFGVAALAFAQLLGVVVDRMVLLQMLPRRVPWFSLRPCMPDRIALRGVARDTLPLIGINLSGQLFGVFDLVVVGAVVGASAVGIYQVAVMTPIYALGILVVGYNVVFPSLAGSDDSAGQETATAFLTRLFCFVGGAALALAALLRRDLVDVLLGEPSRLGENVVVIFCGVSLANLLVHGMASLLLARGHHRLMARAVAIELPVNLVLTVTFVVAFGAVGAAIATLATVALMDFVIFPFVSRGQFARSALLITLRQGIVPAAIGGAVAVIAARVGGVADAPAQRLMLAALVAGGLGAGVGLAFTGASGRKTLRDAVRADPGVAPDRSAMLGP